MSSFVHSESQMCRKAQDMLERNTIPVLHMSDERHIFENKEDYYERLKYEYIHCFQKYPEMFHVVNHDSLFSGHVQQGRTLIDMNEILRNAVVNNCKVIVTDDNSNNTNMLFESRRLMDSYIHNFNTEHDSTVYKMYDVSSEHEYDHVLNDIEIHADFNVHIGIVLRVTHENDYDTVSDIIKYIEQENINADVIIADDSNEHMNLIRVQKQTCYENNTYMVRNQLPTTMNEILFTLDDRDGGANESCYASYHNFETNGIRSSM